VLEQDAQAELVALLVGWPIVAEGGAAVLACIVPAAAAQHAVVALCWAGRVPARAGLVIVLIEPVGAPLRHVAVQVVQTPGVGRRPGGAGAGGKRPRPPPVGAAPRWRWPGPPDGARRRGTAPPRDPPPGRASPPGPSAGGG